MLIAYAISFFVGLGFVAAFPELWWIGAIIAGGLSGFLGVFFRKE